MRQGLTPLAVLIGAGLCLGVTSHDAGAAPFLAVSSAVVTPAMIETVGYSRRYCRRYGCPPNVVLPDVDVDVDVDVTVPGETPPVIAIVPARPVSCGQYRYWDGERCVDARYNNPYLGPR
ncbi:MAG: hypothetical protein WBW51_02120 [Methyloceanibacter sp.]